MTKYRCATVCLHAAAETVASLDASLAALPALACAGTGAADPATPPDVIVIAAAPAAVCELVAQISHLRRERPDCAILVAGDGFHGAQIAAVFSAGAHDFVATPVAGGELWARLQRALGLLVTETAPRVLDAMSPHMREFIGHSPAFLKQIAKLPTIAGCDAGVLILGETGTGKEVCAQAIHYSSARASKPWIAVNCGAIPLELIESELFGHVRGAYTTAHTAREGLIAEAQGGTLFLDDIDCLPMSAQAKLLRFLQEHEYRAVGANAVRHADVRVIAASNRNLSAVMARGEFRRDLYFRLNVLTLTLPPLRERHEDIPELALYMVAQFSKKQRREPPALSPQAVRKLLAHDWPGNVRELQHVIERSLLLSKGHALSAGDIDIAGAAAGEHGAESFQSAKDRVVEQFERNYIEQLLVTFEGNVTHAAQEAKKNRRAFFELIRKHGIEPERFRPGSR
jgi:DNA-binding NtrC family response regulator